MATQQEQLAARRLLEVVKAQQPIRRMSGNNLVIDYGNGNIVTLPLSGGSDIQRTTTVSNK